MMSNSSARSRQETTFNITRMAASRLVPLSDSEQIEDSAASVTESPLANSVTSWPRLTISSVSRLITNSVPPYATGGTLSSSGAIMAIRMSDA